MTCVVGLISNDAVYLGADSAVSGGHIIQTLTDKKVFKKGPYGVGFAGALRTGQLIKYHMKTPSLTKSQKADPVKSLSTTFVNAMRKCLKEGGASRENSGEEEHDNDFIITIKNRLFVIDCSYSVCEVKGKYTAIGSGADFALGSLHSTEDYDISPEERVLLALKASAEFCATVQGPFEILIIPKD